MISGHSTRKPRWLPTQGVIRSKFFGAAIAIVAIATAGCASSVSSLVPSARKVDFGNVAVGASTSQLLTLTNMENVNVTIAEVSVSGKGFSVSGGSHVVLAPNQGVTVSIGFNPAREGKNQGSLFVTSDALSSRVRIALSGSGEAKSSKHSVELTWQASASPSLGYFVYRSTGNRAPSKLNTSLVPSTSFTDTAVVSGETYNYAVTSVNSTNIESATSNEITVTIPTP